MTEDIFEQFFDYFLGFHAVQCDKQDCVCKASTFQDMICNPILRGSDKYGRTIEEVLAK